MSSYYYMNTEEDMEKRYVAELEKALVKRSEELQAERMVTFKLSQQIERKDAALKECLRRFSEEGIDIMDDIIKEALK